MHIVLEVSRPVQWLPGFYRSRITWFRVWWLIFAVSIHPMRHDELLEIAVWDNHATL